MGSVIYDDEQRTDELLFLRPYLQKQKCYQHEQEVRVVFPREPGATAGTNSPDRREDARRRDHAFASLSSR